jgi:hypothetical protein
MNAPRRVEADGVWRWAMQVRHRFKAAFRLRGTALGGGIMNSGSE